MLMSPFFSFLEGCGLVAPVARLRFFSTTFGNLAQWASLLGGLGLLSSPILNAVGLAFGVAYLASRRRAFVGLWHDRATKTVSFDWKKELLPLQWRTAVTVMAGYLTWQTANPILFKLAGPEEAGRLGMSLNLCGILQGFGMAWINTRVPRMSGLYAQGDKAGLRLLFKKSLIQAILVVALGGFALVLAVLSVRLLKSPLKSRLLTPAQMGILLLGTMASTIQIAFVIYARTYKREFFVRQMISMGFAMPAVCDLTGLVWGVTGMLIGMALETSCQGCSGPLAIVRSANRSDYNR